MNDDDNLDDIKLNLDKILHVAESGPFFTAMISAAEQYQRLFDIIAIASIAGSPGLMNYVNLNALSTNYLNTNFYTARLTGNDPSSFKSIMKTLYSIDWGSEINLESSFQNLDVYWQKLAKQIPTMMANSQANVQNLRINIMNYLTALESFRMNVTIYMTKNNQDMNMFCNQNDGGNTPPNQMPIKGDFQAIINSVSFFGTLSDAITRRINLYTSGLLASDLAQDGANFPRFQRDSTIATSNLNTFINTNFGKSALDGFQNHVLNIKNGADFGTNVNLKTAFTNLSTAWHDFNSEIHLLYANPKAETVAQYDALMQKGMVLGVRIEQLKEEFLVYLSKN